MTLQTIRRISADLFKSGESRVRILDPAKAAEALTRDDVRALIQQGVITVQPKQGVGRSKAEFKEARKHAGRRRGPGSKKGTPFARESHKERWMKRVRSQRRVLASMRHQTVEGAYRKAYAMIKGGAFRDKKHLLTFLRENKMLKT